MPSSPIAIPMFESRDYTIVFHEGSFFFFCEDEEFLQLRRDHRGNFLCHAYRCGVRLSGGDERSLVDWCCVVYAATEQTGGYYSIELSIPETEQALMRLSAW